MRPSELRESLQVSKRGDASSGGGPEALKLASKPVGDPGKQGQEAQWTPAITSNFLLALFLISTV